LRPLGIDADCLPLADVPLVSSDPVIGDRAYGREPEKVAAIAEAIANGLLTGGGLPGVKDLPWHRRAPLANPPKLPALAPPPGPPRGGRFCSIPAAGGLADWDDCACCF